MMKLFPAGVLWMFLLASFARPVSADDAKEAKRAFVAGGKLFEAKKYAEASVEFRRAYDIRPNWKILYNIAQSEAAARNYGLALEVFERYLAGGGDEIDVERTNEVLGEIERLKKMVGYLEIGSAEDGLSVLVDGTHRGDTPLPGPLALTAGVELQVTVLKGDEVIVERTVRIPGGQITRLAVSGEGSEGPPSPDAVASPMTDGGSGDGGLTEAGAGAKDRYRPLTIAGWSVMGVGVGLLIGATVTGAMAVKKDDALAPKCEGGCPLELEDDKLAVDRLALATDVLIGVGAAAAVTGGVLLIVGAVKKKNGDREMALLPRVGNGGVGFTLTGEL